MTVSNHPNPSRTWAETLSSPLRTTFQHLWVERLFGLSSRPGARLSGITVKRQAGGLVPPYLHERVRAGEVLTLSQPDGDCAPSAPLPEKILLLSAGSGIAPVMAMLRDLQARGYPGDVLFLHVCRNRDELIVAKELRAIEEAFPELSLLVHFEDTDGPFTTESRQYAVPDLAERSTWMCGPDGFMDLVHHHWLASAIGAPLHSQRIEASATRSADTPASPPSQPQ